MRTALEAAVLFTLEGNHMIANANGFSYDCGLGYPVLLPDGYPLDGSTDGAAAIALTALIAEAIALRPGPLTGPEIRFLREHLGHTPEALEDLIDFPADMIRTCESGNCLLGRENDVELRRLVFTHNEKPLPSLAAFYGLYGSVDPVSFVIRIRLTDPDASWQLAA